MLMATAAIARPRAANLGLQTARYIWAPDWQALHEAAQALIASLQEAGCQPQPTGSRKVEAAPQCWRLAWCSSCRQCPKRKPVTFCPAPQTPATLPSAWWQRASQSLRRSLVRSACLQRRCSASFRLTPKARTSSPRRCLACRSRRRAPQHPGVGGPPCIPGCGCPVCLRDGSTPPMRGWLEDFIASGLLQYRLLEGPLQPGRRQQLAVYDDCLTRNGARHAWMGEGSARTRPQGRGRGRPPAGKRRRRFPPRRNFVEQHCPPPPNPTALPPPLAFKPRRQVSWTWMSS